ncbi:MAG: hypothetical protein V1917_02570 [Candidatus Gottesmanbacteria bacterium]
MTKFIKKKSRISVSLVLSLFVVVFLGVSTLVISGNFASIVTPFAPLIKLFASNNQPKLTQGFTDAFKADAINTDKWTVGKNGNASIVQTAYDNLRINIPAGNVSSAGKYGYLMFKERFDDKADFRIVGVLYRPIVTGDGSGTTGLRFSSSGSADDEGARIQWIVNGTASKVKFTVSAADGTILESKDADLSSTFAVFRLDRVNKTYRAYYKVDRDESDDAKWIRLGQEYNATLGNAGNVAIFTNNVGKDGKFPKVVGRFDTVRIRWEGEPSNRIEFYDGFSNQVVANKWNISVSSGATVIETPSNNLNLNVPAGAVESKPGRAVITRKEPIVKSDKDFYVQTAMYKPTVTGDGKGAAGLSFRSFTTVDDEAAQIRWVVTGSTSKLVFLVYNPDGTLGERAFVNVDKNKLTLVLKRKGNKYTALYRIGDTDTDWIRIGKEENAVFGANGTVSLFTSNVGEAGKYPRVNARFDGVWGWVAK